MPILLPELALVLVACLAAWAIARRRSPLRVMLDGARRMLLEREYRFHLLAVLAVIALDLVESSFDDALTAALGWDFTPWIHRLEGDLAAGVQACAPLPLVLAATFAYIVLLPVLLAAPMVLAAAEGRRAAYRAHAAGIALNYIVAIPFYLLVPVREMWAGNPEKVHMLLDRVSPAILEAYRANSALDNCFPSLHTSLALTAALLAARGERPGFAGFLWASAAAVVASTLYLGIHWASDVAAGIALAFAVRPLAIAWGTRGAAAGAAGAKSGDRTLAGS
jgi:membrane-associated phospholipid phosphatase